MHKYVCFGFHTNETKGVDDREGGGASTKLVTFCVLRLFLVVVGNLCHSINAHTYAHTLHICRCGGCVLAIVETSGTKRLNHAAMRCTLGECFSTHKDLMCFWFVID